MEHVFKMNIGDYSSDGHGRNEVVVIKSTKPVDEVVTAFMSVGEKINLVKHDRFLIAEEYEDSELSNEHAEVLANAGIKFDDLVYNDGDEEDPEYTIEGTHELVHLVMRIAQKELDFEYEISNDSIPSFNGYGGKGPQIGYGLFW